MPDNKFGALAGLVFEHRASPLAHPAPQRRPGDPSRGSTDEPRLPLLHRCLVAVLPREQMPRTVSKVIWMVECPINRLDTV
jgi:hypothetical protein